MRVLLVDDHPLFRNAMRALLTGLDPAVAVVEAGTLREALAHASTPGIDLVLLDLGLPERDGRGLAALAAVRAAFDGVPVVVVSAEEDPRLVRAAIEGGAAGYLPKSTDPPLAASALRIVLAHGVYLPPHVLQDAPDEADRQAPRFSERQREVLHGLLRGLSNKTIARNLGVAEGTVKAHLWAIYQVLGVTTRTMAMYRAFELGLIGTLGTDAGQGPGT